MAGDIKILIGGDASGLQNELKKSQAELGKTAIAANKLDSSLVSSTKGFANFGSKAQIASTALQGIGDAAGGAASGVTSLGSALLSGGILIAIPLIITGIAALGEAIFGLSVSEKALNSSLEESNKAFTKASANINELTAQVDLAKKGFISKDEVVKEYNKSVGKTIGAVKTFEEVETALISKGPEYIKFMQLKALANYAFAKSAEAAGQALLIASQKTASSVVNKAFDDAINKATKEAEAFNNIANAAEQLAAIVSKKNDFNFFGTDKLDKEIKVKEIKIKEIKIKPAKIKIEGVADGDIDLGQIVQTLNSKLRKGLRSLTDKGEDQDIPLVYKFSLPRGTAAQQILDAINKDLDRIKAEAQRRTQEITNIFQTGAVDALSSLGDAIGQALGGKKDPFKGVFDSIFLSAGNQLQNLGKFLIKEAVQIKLAKEAFKKLLANPVAAIGVGVGLIALGALIKSQIAKEAPGFATGVRNFGGGAAIVGERGPELVQLPQGANVVTNGQLNASSGAGMIVAEYTIRGTDLVTVLKRANAYNSRNAF